MRFALPWRRLGFEILDATGAVVVDAWNTPDLGDGREVTDMLNFVVATANASAANPRRVPPEKP